VSRGTFIDLCYLVAAVGFIVALKALGSPRRARVGNLIAAAGMLLAIAVTFARPGLSHIGLIVGAMAVGVVIGVPAARLVKMTAMPQMVAAFNGVGGGAAAVVSITEFIGGDTKTIATYKVLEVVFGVLVGSVSFSGSVLAFAKLQELMTGRPVTYPGQQPVNAVLGGGIVGLVVAILVTSSTPLLWVLLALARPRRRLCAPDRRRGRAGPHLAAQLVHRPGRGRVGLHARLERPHRGGHPRRRLGHAAHAHDERGDGALASQHLVQRVRLGRHGHR
jgi:hypothetical protein